MDVACQCTQPFESVPLVDQNGYQQGSYICQANPNYSSLPCCNYDPT